MASRQQEYINEVRGQARNLWESFTRLRSLQLEWNALDYTNTLEDGTGVNEGVTRAEVGAVVFDTTEAIKTLMDSGHATNIARLF